MKLKWKRILAWILCFAIISVLCDAENLNGKKHVQASENDLAYDLPETYPSTGQKYWIIFKEGYRNDRIEMTTCDISKNAENAWIEWDKGLYLRDAESQNDYNQYCLSNNQWEQIGSYGLFTDYATSVIASNLDVYNTSGELVIKKTNIYTKDINSENNNTRAEYNGHTYIRYDKKMKWDQAKSYCESVGGHLVTITSYDEQKIVETLLTNATFESYWMGAQINNNQWQWVTDETFAYTNWADGEPNGNNNGMYLQMYTRSSPIHITGNKGEWDDTWNDGDSNGIQAQGFICEWDSDDVEGELDNILSYDQYQALYYSTNASHIIGAYMTYSEIEDNYTPTQYVLNNILSFGWNKKFGFTDDAQVWETVILDVLFQNAANSSAIENWEKDSIKLSNELCDFIEKNNLADLDASLTFDVQNNLNQMIEKIAKTEELTNKEELTKVVKGLADTAMTVKEFVDNYVKYIKLRKLVDTDMKAFLYKMKNTSIYNDIPAFQRALDEIIKNINVDSTKLVQLIAMETALQEIVKKTINMVIGTAVKLLLGEKIYKLIDVTKSTTIHLMNTICGTDELAQLNVYLYMLDRIDEAASEAFENVAASCLDSKGKEAYRAVNGGLEFITSLYTYGISVCRQWNEVIATDILMRIETGPYISVKRVHYDMANSYLNLNHASTKDEKKQFIEEKCKTDEEYVDVVLNNQSAFARIQWYHDSGADENENDCLVIFKVQNPNGRFTLYAQITPKNATLQFPELPSKSGYLPVKLWYTDSEYKDVVDASIRITKNTIFYTKYIPNILFEQKGTGGIKIISINGASTPMLRTSTFSLKSNQVYEIPSYIDGYRVEELGDDIFSSCPNITSIFIPATVLMISDNAFESLSLETQFQYVEGSVAETYIKKNKGYQNTISSKELVLAESVINMKIGEKKQVKLEQTGSSISEEIHWSSSDNSIVEVENGYISALKKGRVILTVSTSYISTTCEVRVSDSEDEQGTETTEPPETPKQTIAPTNKPITTLSPSQNPTNVPQITTKPIDIIKPTPQPTSKPNNASASESTKVGVGMKFKVASTWYKITSAGGKTMVEYVKSTKKNAKTITIPAKVKYNGVRYKVTSIANNAFKNNKKLQTVTIEKYVTKIGNSAFQNCKKLTMLTIGKNVQKIGKKAFYKCKKLRYILVKSKKLKVKNIGDKAFAGGYRTPRLKSDKNKWRAYVKVFLKRGLSSKTVFIIDPVKLKD